jgi:HSP20 family protein
MNIIKYKSPVNFLNTLNEELSNLLDPNWSTGTSTWAPRVDIKSTADKYIVYADIPGVDPKDIDVTLEGNQLSIVGERKAEKTEEGEGYSRTERSFGKFYRQFTLPENIAEDDIIAKCDHGVLTLTIPKVTKQSAKRIQVHSDKK